MYQKFYNPINPLTEHFARNKSGEKKGNILDIIIAVGAGLLVGYFIGRGSCGASEPFDWDEFNQKHSKEENPEL